ncbi:glycosyltransferase [Kamptonema cortianum]|nr:glycosyltransferase [Oscillatoria laete-virens]MDK3159962.1 glycosyltransferase [Kamptonema cortianum]MDL5047197.1 glycosyltransferase [Oscillatoria amoena NRMC-F 0135]MDL5055471.1 glycosyltransferase [Oscillatoria laete-virens NRMC-F 0139]
MKICSAILNWNGQEHLRHLLPSLTKAHRLSGGNIYLIHNGPESESLEWVGEQFPDVIIKYPPANDYLYSYNWLLPQLTEDIVIILNNDLRVEENFIAPLVRHFADPVVFSVSARSREWDDSADSSGPFHIREHHGWVYCDPDFQNQNCVYEAFASGGFMALDRKKFLELGGFDRLYYPAYGEDMDLGFRAWLKGWKNIYEPVSVVYHRESASWNGKERKSDLLSMRSAFLFRWRYFGGYSLQELIYLIKSVLSDCLQGKNTRLKGLICAVKEWRKHSGDKKQYRISKQEFAKISAGWGNTPKA